MQIIPLSEGSFTVDKSKAFIPFHHQSDQLQEKAAGSLLVEIQPFAVITKKDIILIDTGLGFHDQHGTLQLHTNLQKAGINPAQVTKVLMSHLHKDHAGAVTMKPFGTEERFISFPYATYYVQQREFDHAIGIGSASYQPEDFQLLEEFSKVIWLKDDDGWIDGYIRYQISGGHSLFHQVFWIEEDGDIAFFGGDVAPQLQQMKSRFVAKYDLDGKKSMELRQQWWEASKAAHWTFMFYHDIHAPVFKQG